MVTVYDGDHARGSPCRMVALALLAESALNSPRARLTGRGSGATMVDAGFFVLSLQLIRPP